MLVVTNSKMLGGSNTCDLSGSSTVLYKKKTLCWDYWNKYTQFVEYIIILFLDINFKVAIMHLFPMRHNWWATVSVKEKLCLIYLHKLASFSLTLSLIVRYDYNYKKVESINVICKKGPIFSLCKFLPRLFTKQMWYICFQEMCPD